MARLWTNSIRGELSSGVTETDTTWEADIFSELPVVSSPDVLRMTADPNRDEGLGKPEIVEVTDHAAGSTTVTVTREVELGNNGGAAQAWPSGTTVVHALTSGDADNFVTETDANATYVNESGDTMTGDLTIDMGRVEKATDEPLRQVISREFIASDGDDFDDIARLVFTIIDQFGGYNQTRIGAESENGGTPTYIKIVTGKPDNVTGDGEGRVVVTERFEVDQSGGSRAQIVSGWGDVDTHRADLRLHNYTFPKVRVVSTDDKDYSEDTVHVVGANLLVDQVLEVTDSNELRMQMPNAVGRGRIRVSNGSGRNYMVLELRDSSDSFDSRIILYGSEDTQSGAPLIEFGSADVVVNQDFDVNGAKNARIVDPIDEGTAYRFGADESPHAGRLTYDVDVTIPDGGHTSLNVPEHISRIAAQARVRCIEPQGHLGRACGKIVESASGWRIDAEGDPGEYFVEVVAVRDDQRVQGWEHVVSVSTDEEDQ